MLKWPPVDSPTVDLVEPMLSFAGNGSGGPETSADAPDSSTNDRLGDRASLPLF
jgi:hypothetical protein